MFNSGNLQMLGGAPRREVLRGALKTLDGEHSPADRPAVKPSLFLRGGKPALLPAYPPAHSPALFEGASAEQRSLLNCILNLSKLLAESAGSKLSPKQIDYAQTIYAAGTQLLSYIDRQILDGLADGLTDGLTRGAQQPSSQEMQTYRGTRSRRSDDGFALMAQNDASAASGRRQNMPELAGKTVLIVDDDILNIYAMTAALEQQGMIVMHAEDGLAGLEMLRIQVDVDAVIMNTGMQALGCRELIGAMRGIPSFASKPIIAVTACNAAGISGKCGDIGASDTIAKPINVEQLLSLMRAWLTRA